MPRCGLRLALACFLTTFGGWAPRSHALDPSRALTQYGMDLWREGLPQLSVHVVSQTTDGYLWAGTQQGLVRLNGTRVAIFDTHTTPQLAGNVVWALAAERSGGLWIGSVPGGLTHYAQGRFERYGVAHGLTTEQVWALHVDAGGVLWVGTDDGLFSRRAGRFERMESFPRERVRSLASDRTGLWVGTETAGLFRLEGAHLARHGRAQGLPDERVRALHVDRAGRLWVGLDGGLAIHEAGRFTSYTRRDGLPGDVLRAVLEDRDGNLWLGTFGAGLCRVERRSPAAGLRFSCLDSTTGFASDQVLALFEDREGGLWSGTIGGGLVRLKDGAVTSLTMRDGLPSDLVRGVLETPGGALWVGTDKGLARLEAGRVRVLGRGQGLPHDSVFGLLWEAPDVLWAGTRAGLARITGARVDAYGDHDGLPDGLVRALRRDTAGTLWAGTDRGLARFDGHGFQVLPDAVLGGQQVLSLDPALDGGLWVGTNGRGLLHLRADIVTEAASTRTGLPSNIVRCAYEDGQGALWICTDAGLAVRVDQRVQAVGGPRGSRAAPLSDPALSLTDTRDGNYWISTSHGLFRLARATLLAYARGDALAGTPALALGSADGMKTSECNGDFQPAAWRSHDGRLWIPTVKGLAIVQPGALARALPAPPVVLERLLVDGDSVVLQDDLRLAPGVRRLVFEYAALTFQNPERVRLRYRLEGFDEDWVEAGDRRDASYTNLPPGHYQFQVQSAGNGARFGATLTQVRFSLRPRIYQTVWFYALLGLMVTCTGVGLHLLRVRRLQEREETLARLVAERTAELRQANVELHRLAALDGLTQIANHRRFKEVLEQEWRRAWRQVEPLTLLIVDVDCFKNYNDSYGHQAGDACLQRIAAALRETVRRPFDFVARYGGEEFTVLLPDTPGASALAVAERIRHDVEVLAIPHATSSAAQVVTLSVGIATRVPSAGVVSEDLLRLADTALYAAKRGGRNCVTAAP